MKADTKKTDTRKPSKTDAMKQEIIKKDINAVTASEKQDYRRYTKVIEKSYDKISKEFFVIAGALYEINRKSLFRAQNYKDIVSYAYDLFDMKKTQVYNFINLVVRFGKLDENGCCLGVRDEFAGFSSSKLIRMINVPDEHLNEFKPEMTVKQIIDKVNRLSDTIILERSEPEQQSLPLNDTGIAADAGQDAGTAMPKDYEGLDISVDEDRQFIARLDDVAPDKIDGIKDILNQTYSDFISTPAFAGKKPYFEIILCWE